jgi:hypothetical protein
MNENNGISTGRLFPPSRSSDTALAELHNELLLLQQRLARAEAEIRALRARRGYYATRAELRDLELRLKPER